MPTAVGFLLQPDVLFLFFVLFSFFFLTCFDTGSGLNLGSIVASYVTVNSKHSAEVKDTDIYFMT